MKKFFTSLFALIVLTSTIAQSWIPVGGANPFPGANEHDFTILDNNRPAVAYSTDGANELEVQLWNGAAWDLLPQITPLTVTEVQISNIGNTIIVGFYENYSEYFVYEYVGGAWSQLGDIGVTSELYSSAHLIQGANAGDLWFSFVNQSFNAVVKKWNGLSWAQHGADFIPSTPNLVNGELASDGSKIYYLSNDQNFPDSWLYNANEAVSGFSQYGSNSVVNDVNLVSIDCSPSKLPSVGYVDNLSQGSINFVRPDGVGDFTVDEVITTGPSPVLNFDHDMGADDSMFVVFTDNNGGVKVLHQEGGTMFQYGSELSTNNPSETDIEIFQNSGKPYVLLKEDIVSYVMAFNQTPAYSTDAGSTQICQDATNAPFMSSITFIDNDFDSVYVSGVVSNSTSLVTSGNVFVNRTNPYSSGSNQNIFSINVTPQAGQSGIANIDLYISDGLETIIYPINVTIIASPTFTHTSTNATCNATCDGQIDVTVVSGTAPYTYSSNNGSSYQGGNIFTGLCAGNYDLVVLDANGCQSSSVSQSITEPSAITHTPSTINVSCNALCDGQITTTASGGTPPYTYSSNNGSTFQAGSTFTGLCPGNYDLIVQDANGCQTSAITQTITEPSALSFSPSNTNPLCNGTCDGQIDITAFGGTSPYQYSNNNGSTYQGGNSFTSMCAGNYDIVVLDANGCTSISTETLIDPAAVTYVPTITNNSCFGSCDGQITLAAVGGTAPYQYSNNNGSTYQAGNSFSVLCAGNYDVVVQDANGCLSTSTTETVTEPTAISYSPTITNATCNALCDGQIDIAAAGGTAPYTYSSNNGSTYQAGNSLTGLCANNYDVIVQDANACLSAAVTETVTEPSAISYVPTLTNMTCNGICDGQIDISASGGTAPYTYSSNNGSTYQAGNSFTGLCANNYDVIVQDVNACLSAAITETLTEPTVVVATAPGDLALCDGDPTTLNGVGSGGTPPLVYTWNQSVTNGAPFTPALGTLTYTLTVTDNNGCIATDDVDITVNPLPTIIAGSDITGCDGDMVTVNGSGGVSYTWDNGAVDGVAFTQSLGTVTYQVTGVDVNGCENTDNLDITIFANPAAFSVTPMNPLVCGASDGSILLSGLAISSTFDVTYNNGSVQGPFSLGTNTSGELTIPGLAAGSYSDITVTNLNNCSSSDAGPFNLTDPSAPTVNAGTDMTICEGEPVVLTAVNSENALISWNNGILNGHTFFPTNTTTYTVTASSSGCVATDNVTITVNPLPNVDLTISPATCGMTDGSVSSSITNGTAPYSIYWSNGTTGTSINNLFPALYYINVTDANNCYTMKVATVGTSAISVSGIKSDNFCPGDQVGSIDLTVSGAGPFTYSWSNGATTEDISGLASGQYEVMITDGNGCQASASFIINSPPAMYGELVSTNATCGLADGSITSTILGGIPTYSFQWKDNLGAVITGETAATLSNYATGAYSLVATDQNGCTHELFGGISENNGPSVSVDSLIASSCDPDGTINVNVNSGFSITSYNWSTGATTEDLTNIGSGQYSLTVEDVNGCFGVLAVELPALIPATVDICIVGVDTSTNTNLVVWEKPITDEIAYFNVYRESSIAGMFQLVDSVSYNQESSYNDTIAYPGLRSWRYRLGTVDTCGNESILSDEHKTMHVTISSTGGVYNVAWDQYEGFSYPTYFIWRHTVADGWIQIDAVPTTVTSYTETPPTTDGIDYMITIQPPTVCTSTTGKATDYNSSRSNRSTSSTLGNPDDDSGVEATEINVNVYPNPSEGIFQINVVGIYNYEVFVYDISGKLVHIANANNSNYNLDLTGVHPGSYLLRIQSENGIANQQLIVR